VGPVYCNRRMNFHLGDMLGEVTVSRVFCLNLRVSPTRVR